VIVNGLTHVTIPLPSKNEKCLFTLKPISHTVEDFIEMLKMEDAGISRASVTSKEGVKICTSTSVQDLFQQEFNLHVNDRHWAVKPPGNIQEIADSELFKFPREMLLIRKLHEVINAEDLKYIRDKELVKQLEDLEAELQPLEEQHNEILKHAETRTRLWLYGGLGFMAFQFGFLCRLTYWEYSWDIVEPITYFITFTTGIFMYAYFVLTRTYAEYDKVTGRTELVEYHSKARRHRWDVRRYNHVKDQIIQVQKERQRVERL